MANLLTPGPGFNTAQMALVKALVEEGVTKYKDYLKGLSGKTLIRVDATGYDQTSEIQQRLDDMYASKGGTSNGETTQSNTGTVIELVDGNDYAISGLLLPPGACITSVSRALLPFSDKPGATSGARPTTTGPVIRHISPNQPCIQNNPALGISRDGAQKFSNNVISGIAFTCDRFTSSRRGDADMIRFTSAFGTNLFGCVVFTSAGFGLRITGSNAFYAAFNSFLYAPWFWHGVVDSQYLINQVGGGNGFGSDVVWMTGDTENNIATRLNMLQGNLFYNNNNNGNAIAAYAPAVKVLSIVGDTLTLESNVGSIPASNGINWIGATPLQMSAATFPTATGYIARGHKVVWCTVLGSGNQIKLSKTFADKNAGIYIDWTSAGADVSVQVGGNSNLNLTAGAKNNTFLGTRVDQAFGNNLTLNGAPDNTFESLLSIYSHMGQSNPGGSGGYKAPTPGPGIQLLNGSTGNRFTGRSDGVQHTAVGAGPSAHMYAIDCDDSSIPGLDVDGLVCINHTAANSAAGAAAFKQAQLNPRRISIPPSRWQQVSGTVNRASSLSDKDSLNFATASSAASQQSIPTKWRNLRARIIFANNGVIAGTVTWGIRMAGYSPGSSLGGSVPILGNTVSQVIAGASDQYQEYEVIIELGSTDALLGKYVPIRLYRGDSAGPTVQLLDFILEESM